MKYAIVNAEYEKELFKDVTGAESYENILRTRINRQYLFYIINGNQNIGLIAPHIPSNEFQDYFASIGVQLPLMKGSGDGFNWYGKLTNLELERKLNSKIETYQFLEARNELPLDFHLVDSCSDIKRITSKGSQKKWLLKSPYSCGGIGTRVLASEGDIPSQITYTHILEPYLERLLDFAVYYDPASSLVYPYISLIQSNGGYVGGQIFDNPDDMWKELASKQLVQSFENCLMKVYEYLAELKKLPLEQPITIDGFVYRNSNGLGVGYPMCEINYRISMGSFNLGLRRFLPPGGAGKFISIKSDRRDIQWTKLIPYSLETRTGVISLNDANPQTGHLLLVGHSAKMVDKMFQLILQAADDK